jgi:hypothetical protein
MLNREDVERIIENVLRGLRITITIDDANPNDRKITLLHGDTVLSIDYFDVDSVPYKYE